MSEQSAVAWTANEWALAPAASRARRWKRIMSIVGGGQLISLLARLAASARSQIPDLQRSPEMLISAYSDTVRVILERRA